MKLLEQTPDGSIHTSASNIKLTIQHLPYLYEDVGICQKFILVLDNLPLMFSVVLLVLS